MPNNLLDVDKFLQEVYDFSALRKNSEALDLINDKMCMRSLEEMPYELMNEIVGKVDISKISYSIIICFLVQTFKYDKVVPNHIILYRKFEQLLKDNNEPDKRLKGLLVGLEGSGNYWKDMAAFGAPEWLKGHEPE